MHIDDPGYELIQDIRTTAKKPFNSQAFNKLSKETLSFQHKMQAIKTIAENEEITTEMSINFMLLKKYEERNERIRKTYIRHRFLNREMCCNFTEKECSFYKEYDSMYEEYTSEFGFYNECSVPLKLFVRVMAVKECGVVKISDQILELEIDKVYFLRRKYVEHLISNGCLKIV